MVKNMNTSMKKRTFRGTGWAWGYGLQNGKFKMENHSVNLKSAEW